MLREHGYRVTGSDSGVYPPASTLLESLGIAFNNNLMRHICSRRRSSRSSETSIARGNPELEEVLDRKIPYRSLPEILGRCFCRGGIRLLASGTHGKTTTTRCWHGSFIAPGESRISRWRCGGENFGKSYGLGGGAEFILEGDEYETAFWDQRAEIFSLSPGRSDYYFAGV